MILGILGMMQTPHDHLVSAPHPLGYVCVRAASPLQIDGMLTDAAWQAAPWTADFVDIEGTLKPLPRLRTRAKMLWDDRYFYIGATLEEPHVWGTLTEHDSVIFYDNDFELFLDPDGDNHKYYEFEINALNTGWDLFLPKPYRDGGPAMNEWEIPGLKTAIHVDGTLNDPSDEDRGWSVEIAIPWEAIGGKPSAGDQWRVNFSRVQWLTDVVGGEYVKREGLREDNWVWSPQWVIDMHQPQMWGYVQFESEAKPFRPDPGHEARMLLHHVYYRQKSYREKHGKYASTLDALGITPVTGVPAPRIYVTRDGWRASLVGPGHELITIRQDSLVTRGLP